MSGNEENPEQPRVPRNLQGLLRFAMEATKDEDAPNASNYQEMDEERKRFLEEALNSMTVDTIKQLEKAMRLLMDQESEDEDKIEALEIVSDFVMDMDTANDFFKIGGFVILMPCLNSKNSEIRSETLKLIGELAQNNPFCQQKLLELNILPKSMELMSDEPQVAVPALFATSCMVRHHEPCLASFIEIGGLECLLGCLECDHDKLKLKAAFLMSNLCAEFSPIRDEFIKLDAVERIVANIMPIEGYQDKLEAMLCTLCLLIEDKEARRRCSYHLKEKLEEIIRINTGKDECREQIDYAKAILSKCFSDNQEFTDR